jgi:hypothetical protein
MTTAIIKPAWHPLTIALMVVGFIVAWPVGLAVLGYILWGEYMGGSAEKAGRAFGRARSWASGCGSRSGHASWAAGPSSGNAAFDEYRAEQLRRLEEERRRLDEEIEAFHEHMRNLRMARDREEFDRFMRDRHAGRQGYEPGHNA